MLSWVPEKTATSLRKGDKNYFNREKRGQGTCTEEQGLRTLSFSSWDPSLRTHRDRSRPNTQHQNLRWPIMILESLSITAKKKPTARREKLKPPNASTCLKKETLGKDRRGKMLVWHPLAFYTTSSTGEEPIQEASS